jgi:hypothetical protein
MFEIIKHFLSERPWNDSNSLTANAKIAIVMGSIPVSSDTVESEERHADEAVLNKAHIKTQNTPLFNKSRKFYKSVSEYHFVSMYGSRRLIFSQKLRSF